MAHLCLQTPELVDIICQSVEDQRTLAALARTCKSFSSPALDHLWSNMHCLEPLQKCFPNCMWRENNQRERHLHFSCPLAPSDWSRFMIYAPRVRTLVYSPMEHISTTFDVISRHYKNLDSLFLVGAALFQALSIAAPTLGCILPNLRRLFWNPRDDVFPYIRLFLSPHITTIALKLDHNVKPALLSVLPNIIPELHAVDLCFSRIPPSSMDPIITTVSSSIMGWKNLDFVRVVSLNYAAFLPLAALPNLTK